MTQDLTLHHRIASPFSRSIVGKCVWCGGEAMTTALTPGRPDLGALPLHLTCGPFLRDAFRALQEGRQIDEADRPGLLRYAQSVKQLEAAR